VGCLVKEKVQGSVEGTYNQVRTNQVTSEKNGLGKGLEGKKASEGKRLKVSLD